MDYNNPRPSLSLEGQAEATTQQIRRSSLNFFRRISGSDNKLANSTTHSTEASSQSQPRSSGSMLFKSFGKDGGGVKNETTKLEVAPVKQPRIPSFHFDAMTNLALPPRRDSVSPSSSPSSRYIAPRKRFDILGKSYKSQHTPTMPPIPQIPVTPPAQDSYDPFARTSTMTSTMTASITNRGRYGYGHPATDVAVPNSPRRLRRKKDATPFNVLVMGSKNCGKTAFIEFLRSSLARPVKHRGVASPPRTGTYHNYSFPAEHLETDIDGERVGLTLYDSPGLEKGIVDLQLQETTGFIESKFEETFIEEQKVSRSAGSRDTHIHCVLLLLDPARLQSNLDTVLASTDKTSGKFQDSTLNGILDTALDIDVLRALNNLTTVIPLISKADTVTVPQMDALKRTVWKGLKELGVNVLSMLDFDNLEGDSSASSEDDSDDEADNNSSNTEDYTTSDGEAQAKPGAIGVAIGTSGVTSAKAKLVVANPEVELPELPLSIISPDVYEADLVGRRFAWGFADPNNSAHCDFPQVKESIFSDWRDDLKDTSRTRCYERWRTTRLKKRTSPMVSRYRAERKISGTSAHTSSNDIGYSGVV